MSYFSSSYLILPALLKMGTSGGLGMECGMGAVSTPKVAHSYAGKLVPSASSCPCWAPHKAAWAPAHWVSGFQ